MREVRVTEARTRWSELLRAVEQGEAVAITRRGRTIARLVPAPHQEPTSLLEAPSPGTQTSRREAVARFRAWRRQWRPVQMSTEEILAAIREGRR